MLSFVGPDRPDRSLRKGLAMFGLKRADLKIKVAPFCFF